MSFLFPAMLLGLLGLSIPVVLHLIARHKYQVHEFPSIRLLLPDERSNVFAMRLVDIGQLLLRLAVLLLLVLAMARLFAAWWPFGRTARNLVVVVDCSASMNTVTSRTLTSRRFQNLREVRGEVKLVDLAKDKAAELLRGVAPPSQCALVAGGEQAELLAPLQPSSDAALAALDGLRAADGAGRGLVHAVARCCDLVRGRREARSQIVVLTDLCATAFEARNQRDLQRIGAARRALGRSLEIVLVDTSAGRSDNLAIVEAAVRGSRVKVGDDAHIVARVLNSSDAEKKARLSLAVGNRREPAAKEVTLEPGGQADVDLTVRVNRAVQTFVEAQVASDDALPHDNAFAVPLEVSDARRVLIVDGAAAAAREAPLSSLGDLGGGERPAAPEPEESLDSARILRLVLNPGRELGHAHGTGIQATAVTPEALAGQPLSKYDIIALCDVSTLPEQALKDLHTFVRQGRSLLFVCSGGTNAMKFNRAFAAASGDRGPLSPAALGNERACDPPVGMWTSGNPHPVVAPFRDRLKGDLSVIRFTTVRDIEWKGIASGASVVWMGGPLAGSRHPRLPLAVEMPIERGRVMLLAFGFELGRGNIARTRAFPALMWQLVSYLTGQLKTRPPDVLTASRPTVLDVSEPAFAFLNELELASDQESKAPPLRLAISEGRTVLLGGLPVGRYLLRKPQRAGDAARRSTYARHVAVNPDPRESRTARIAPAELASLFGEGLRTAGIGDALDLAPRGGELWMPLIVLLALAYAAEGAVGWLLSARREKERTAGGEA